MSPANNSAVDIPALGPSSPLSEKEVCTEERSPTTPHPVSNLVPTEKPNAAADPTSQDLTEDGGDKDLERRVPAGVEAAATVDANLDGPEWEYPEGGRGWWVVAGCTIIAGVTLGWGLAWGVLQAYYKQHLFPDEQNAVLSLLGSLSGPIMNVVGFVVGKLADRYGYRICIVVGEVLAFAAMIGAAFSTKLWQFFLTQGVLQGLAVGCIQPVVMSSPSQWFRKRRGFATGIVLTGASFGGGVASLCVQRLLTLIGLRYTLLFYAFLHLFLMTIAVFMMQDRPHPLSTRFTKAKIKWFDFTLFKDPIFWSVALAMFWSAFGYLGPYFYIQQYTIYRLPDLNPSLYAVPLSVINFSAAVGRCSMGFVADKLGVVNTFIGSVFLAGFAQLVLWNLADSFGVIMLFTIVVGFSGAAFVSLSSVLGAKLFGVADLAALSGLLVMFMMPGNAAGTPILGAIYSATGGNWHAVFSLSGAWCITGACCLLYARFKKEPRIFAIY